jgi:hypothetical protein
MPGLMAGDADPGLAIDLPISHLTEFGPAPLFTRLASSEAMVVHFGLTRSKRRVAGGLLGLDGRVLQPLDRRNDLAEFLGRHGRR